MGRGLEDNGGVADCRARLGTVTEEGREGSLDGSFQTALKFSGSSPQTFRKGLSYCPAAQGHGQAADSGEKPVMHFRARHPPGRGETPPQLPHTDARWKDVGESVPFAFLRSFKYQF